MQVEKKLVRAGNRSIEFGPSSWDPTVRAARNRYDHSSGRILPHNSSEISLDELFDLATTTATEKEWGDGQLETLAAACLQQMPTDRSIAVVLQKIKTTKDSSMIVLMQELLDQLKVRWFELGRD